MLCICWSTSVSDLDEIPDQVNMEVKPPQIFLWCYVYSTDVIFLLDPNREKKNLDRFQACISLALISDRWRVQMFADVTDRDQQHKLIQ